MLIYVDEIILTATSQDLIQKLIVKLGTEFALKDLGTLHYFLGLEVTYHSQGLMLSQREIY